MNAVRSLNRVAVGVVCVVAFLVVPLGSMAQVDQSTATVIDKKGEKYTIQSFTFTDSAEKIQLQIPTLTFDCSQLFGNPLPKEVKRIIPLSSVKKITVNKPGEYNIPGEAHIVLVSGSTSTVQCGTFSIKGKQDLGELGSGDFSMANEMKEVSFSWKPQRGAGANGLWPTDTSKSYRGKVIVGTTTLTFDRMALYFQTSGSSCPIHSWCVGCNMRSSWTSGNVADFLKINKSNTEIQLELAKVSQIDFVNYPDVSITLKSGTKTDCKLQLDGFNQGILAYDGQGWIFVPREQIKSITFE